jgi:hypothetical protein
VISWVAAIRHPAQDLSTIGGVKSGTGLVVVADFLNYEPGFNDSLAPINLPPQSYQHFFTSDPLASPCRDWC